ncbi:MAG: universal stress protein [Nannocystaceae bacterium]
MRFSRVLCPVDFSDRSRAALAVADSIAERDEATLTLFYAHPLLPGPIVGFDFTPDAEIEERQIESAKREIDAWASALRTPQERVRSQVLVGDPVAAIIEASEEHDLVVMATHGRTGVSRFMLGSVAERIARAATCSVLIVKHRESDEDE